MNPLGLTYIDDQDVQSPSIESIQEDQNLLPRESESTSALETVEPSKIAESLVVESQMGVNTATKHHTEKVVEVTQRTKKKDIMRSLRASYRVAEYSWELNLLASDLLNGNGDPDALIHQIRLLENKIQQEQPFVQKDTVFKHALNSAAGILPPVIDIAASGTKVGGYAAIAAGTTAAYLSAGPQAVAAPITIPAAMSIAFGVGTQTQAARRTAKAESGAIYWKLINMKDEQGNSIDPVLVAGISQAVGVINGLAEVFGIRILMRFLPGTRRLIGGYIDEAGKQVTKSGFLENLVKQYIKKYPKFVSQESGIELGQAIVTSAGEEMTKFISNELDKTSMDMKTKEQIVSELAEELRTAAEGIALTGLPFPAINAAIDSKSTVKKNNAEGASVLPSDKVLDKGQNLLNSYNELIDTYITNTDEQSFRNRAQNKKLHKQLRHLAGEIQKEFPDIVTSPEQAIALGKEFSATELSEMMQELDIEVAKLKEEAFSLPEADIVKLNRSMEGATKRQGAREALEFQYREETGAKDIKQEEFQPWLKEKLVKEIEEVKQKPIKVKKLKVELLNDALQLNIDNKRDPGKVKEIYDKSIKWHEEEINLGKKKPQGILTKQQIAVIDKSNNLTPKELTFVDEITSIYNEVGKLNIEERVLRNLEDNYAARLWNLSMPDAQRVYTTFYKDTRHAKDRRINTIVEGWSQGLKLQVSGATQNLGLYKDTMIKTLLQRKLFNALKEVIGEVDSVKRPGKKMRQKLLLPYKAAGYTKIDLSNFKMYSPLEIGDPGGKILETEDGTVLKETAIYAPKEIAKNIEKLFGVSILKKSDFINTFSKYNALIKVITLALSGFHALAFVASYYLGAPTGFKNLNVYKAFKEGNRMGENLDPIIIQGIRNRLTVDLKQDWQISYLHENNVLNSLMDKTKTTGWIKDQVVILNERWLNWVFSSFGAGLKMKTFALEYQKQLAKFPSIDPNIIARNVADLVNSDFGGLHLKGLKRSPTIQHLLQLGLLAPDWTESNLRTVTGMFRKTGKNPAHIRQLHRHFWARIVVKGLAATAFVNLSLALLTGTGNDRWEDIEDFFNQTMKSWEQMITELGRGNFRRGYKRYTQGTDSAVELVRELTSVNITPIYKYFGGNDNDRKYFSIFRHFSDPVKFVLKPGIVLRHKASMAGHMLADAYNQEDWKGRRFTTIPELLGGEGLVTYKSRYAEGTPIVDSWYLSYALSQIIGHTPIGMNNLISSISGETEYADSILNTLGVHVATRKRR